MKSISRTAVIPAALLALGLLAGCGDDSDAGSAKDSASDTSNATSPAATDTASGDASDGTAAPNPSVVPTYFVGTTPHGDRLFREFTQVDGVDPLVGAATAVASGGPVDPDYRTLWPKGRVQSVAVEADAIVLTLSDDTLAQSGGLSTADARLAVQQMVYSLQGAAQKALPLKVTYDGQPAATLLGLDASKGFTTSPQLDVLALVNVTEPAEGTTVTGSFTAEGRASSFEATVPWEIRDGSGKAVLDGFSTADGWADKLHPWTTTIDVSSLAPGTYTFVARTDDPSDDEGFGPTEDTKRITIE